MRDKEIDQLIKEVEGIGKVPAKESWNGMTHAEVLSYNQALSDVLALLKSKKEK